MSIRKRKCWYSNNCLHCLKRTVPLLVTQYLNPGHHHRDNHNAHLFNSAHSPTGATTLSITTLSLMYNDTQHNSKKRDTQQKGTPYKVVAC